MKDCWERSGKVDENLNHPVLGNRWMYIKESVIVRGGSQTRGLDFVGQIYNNSFGQSA